MNKMYFFETSLVKQIRNEKWCTVNIIFKGEGGHNPWILPSHVHFMVQVRDEWPSVLSSTNTSERIIQIQRKLGYPS